MALENKLGITSSGELANIEEKLTKIKAIELFERAARTEYDGNALYELGYLYENPGETSENLEKAADYYQKAIEMGNENAARRFSHFKKSLFGRWKLIP